jgi:hypothetical protein
MLRSLLLPLILLALSTALLTAQRTEDQARDDLRYGSDNRRDRISEGGDIWYGAGAQVGFQSFRGQNYLRLGVSPIVGYKLNNFLSVGPRASLLYNRFSQNGFSESFITWSAGAFARAKIYRGFFAHAEYSAISDVDYLTGQQRRTIAAAPFLGAGLNQGGGPGQFGFEISILFRLTPPEFLNDRPYLFRTGVNFNF